MDRIETNFQGLKTTCKHVYTVMYINELISMYTESKHAENEPKINKISSPNNTIMVECMKCQKDDIQLLRTTYNHITRTYTC